MRHTFLVVTLTVEMIKIGVHLVIYESYRKIKTRVPLFWTTQYIRQKDYFAA